jgi:hypothetical protein
MPEQNNENSSGISKRFQWVNLGKTAADGASVQSIPESILTRAQK